MTSIPFSADASGAEFRPIGAYGMLADGSTAALVSDQGSVDWLCFPRFDAPALFARILDPAAGHWSIRPLNVIRHHRRYLPGTLVIETTFTTSTGSVTVTDALAVAHGQRGHDLGLAAPHRLLRVVRGRLGQVTMLMEFAPPAGVWTRQSTDLGGRGWSPNPRRASPDRVECRRGAPDRWRDRFRWLLRGG